jgi:hypothetical protein
MGGRHEHLDTTAASPLHASKPSGPGALRLTLRQLEPEPLTHPLLVDPRDDQGTNHSSCLIPADCHDQSVHKHVWSGLVASRALMLCLHPGIQLRTGITHPGLCKVGPAPRLHDGGDLPHRYTLSHHLQACQPQPLLAPLVWGQEGVRQLPSRTCGMCRMGGLPGVVRMRGRQPFRCLASVRHS